jgi:hypothetical protein
MTRAWTQPKWRSQSNVVFVQQVKDAGLWLRRCFAEHFGNAGSNPAHDATINVLALTIRENRNRPQRLGGTGTRHRNLYLLFHLPH